MAPEYALWGHLSYKVDVYSFGVVALEIVSGKNNNKFIPKNDSVCLLDWVLFQILSMFTFSIITYHKEFAKASITRYIYKEFSTLN